MTDKTEMDRREALVDSIIGGAPSGLDMTRDKVRFMVDLAAKAADDAQNTIIRYAEMLEPEHRAVAAIITAKTINAAMEMFLDVAKKDAIDRLGLKDGKSCDCDVCKANAAMEAGEQLDPEFLEGLKAAGFSLVAGGDGFVVLQSGDVDDTLQ